jgi:hypothetical protein
LALFLDNISAVILEHHKKMGTGRIQACSLCFAGYLSEHGAGITGNIKLLTELGNR